MDFLQLESTPNPESNKVLLTYLLTDRAESRDAIASKNHKINGVISEQSLIE